jgi:phage FluMu protein Com
VPRLCDKIILEKFQAVFLQYRLLKCKMVIKFDLKYEAENYLLNTFIFQICYIKGEN